MIRSRQSSSSNLRISTIIPTYDCEPYLQRAVESLLATGYTSLEIVIVDDGSRDGTLDVAKQLEQAYPGQVFAHQHPGGGNRGVSATRNHGIGVSSGDLIAFLDGDDYVYPHRFDSALAILQEQPAVDAVYDVADLAFADAEAQSRWWDGPRVFGFTQPIASEELLASLLQGLCWHTSAIVLRRSLLARTGLFDPRLRIAEDCHLWMRMACVGKIVAGDLSRPVSVYWRHNDSAYQPLPRQRLHMIRAMALFRRWMRAKFPGDRRLPFVSRCISDYILRGIVDARAKQQRQLAWSLVFRSLWSFPPVGLRRQFIGNAWRTALGR